jgi:hypothetical protein
VTTGVRRDRVFAQMCGWAHVRVRFTAGGPLIAPPIRAPTRRATDGPPPAPFLTVVVTVLRYYPAVGRLNPSNAVREPARPHADATAFCRNVRSLTGVSWTVRRRRRWVDSSQSQPET